MALEYRSMDMKDHYEVWEGAIVIREPAAVPHEQVVGRLYLILMQYVDKQGSGIVLLSNTAVHTKGDSVDYVMPDLTFVSQERMHLVHGNGIAGAPDLAVEVVSPGLQNTKRDLVDKFQLYERSGVKEYWMVDYAGREIQMFGLIDGQYVRIEQSTVLPGIELEGDSLFQGIIGMVNSAF